MLHSLRLPRRWINSKRCLPLCATGLEVGDKSVEKMLFPKTILSHSTTPYLGYFLCILVVRFPIREHLLRLPKIKQQKQSSFPERNYPFSLPWVVFRFVDYGVGLCVGTIFTRLFAYWKLKLKSCVHNKDNTQLWYSHWRPLVVDVDWERRTCLPQH